MIPMIETKILCRHPSIRNIQLARNASTASLTLKEMTMLFKGSTLPKFEVMDIKSHDFFIRHPRVQFFVSKLENWNKKDDQKYDMLNSRSQFLILDFIHAALKRISLLSDREIAYELENLYSWYINQGKKRPALSNPAMPDRKNTNEQYDVIRTFKTNPALLIEQYRRPKHLFPPARREEAAQDGCAVQKISFVNSGKMTNNFLTELQPTDLKPQAERDKQNRHSELISIKSMFTRKEQIKARQDELRKFIEMKEIEQRQWYYNIKKGRLISEGARNFSASGYHNNQRTIKSSQEARSSANEGLVTNQIKRLRVQRSAGRKPSYVNPKKDVRIEPMPEVPQIGAQGLMVNPLQINKLKKKKKTKK